MFGPNQNVSRDNPVFYFSRILWLLCQYLPVNLSSHTIMKLQIIKIRSGRVVTAFTCFLLFSVHLFGDLPDGLPVTDGLSVYLDGESVQTSGDRVVRMIDRTGNENDAWEQIAGDPSLPILVEGATPTGLNAIRFDGLGGFADVPSNPVDFDGRAKATFIVFKADELGASASAGSGRLMNTAYSIIDSWEPEGQQPHERYRTSDIWTQSTGVLRLNARNPFGNFVATQTPNNSVAAGEFYIGVKEWRSNGDIFARIRDAANQTFTDDAIGAMAEPEGHIHTRIGATSNIRNTRPEEFFGGEIAAVLIYNRDLSTNEREDIEGYLHATYLDAGSGGSEPGTPPVTSGLILHLNGENVVTDDGLVTEIVDVSGRNNNAIARVHDPRPGLPTLLGGVTPSGRDAVRFDGVGSYADVASNPEDFDGRAKTTLVVFRAEHLAGSDYIFNSAYEILDPALPQNEQSDLRTRTNQMRAYEEGGGNLRVSARNASGGFVGVSTPEGSIRAGEFMIGVNHLRENGDLASIVRDQMNQRHITVGSGADADPSGHINTRLGGTNAAGEAVTPGEGEFFEGEVAAMLVYNRELSDSELQQVESYLYETYLDPAGGAGAPGEPPVTADLVLHLNGDNVVTDGNGTVATLLDTSGRENHATTFVHQPARDGGPTFVASGTPSGKPAVHFDGNLQFLEIAGSPEHFDGRAKTTIAVFEPDRIDDARIVNMAYTALHPTESPPSGRTRLNEVWLWSSNNRFRVANRATVSFVAAATPNETLASGEYFIGINHWKADGETVAILRDSSNQRFEGTATGADALPEGHLHTRIGAGSGFGNLTPDLHYAGKLAAVLVYNRELSEQELEQVEGYLFDRYILPGGASGFDEWIAQFDIPAELRGPEDDASGDGIKNLVKFAIGRDPTVPSLDGLPELFIETEGSLNYLGLHVHKNADAEGIQYTIETSTNLFDWHADSENVVILEDDAETLRAHIATSMEEEPRAFIRLSVSSD